MGLDIVIFNKGGKKDFTEIKENLHYWIFNESIVNINSYKELTKIKDYYLTDVIFSGTELKDFINELKSIQHPDINKIIEKIEQDSVEKIRIAGD